MNLSKLFSGRLSLKGYWLSLLAICILFFPFTDMFTTLPQTNLVVRYTLGIILITWILSIFIRRLHDLDKSGMYVLLLLVPIVEIFLLLYLNFWLGDKKRNKFGTRSTLKKELFPFII